MTDGDFGGSAGLIVRQGIERKPKISRPCYEAVIDTHLDLVESPGYIDGESKNPCSFSKISSTPLVGG